MYLKFLIYIEQINEKGKKTMETQKKNTFYPLFKTSKSSESSIELPVAQCTMPSDSIHLPRESGKNKKIEIKKEKTNLNKYKINKRGSHAVNW